MQTILMDMEFDSTEEMLVGEVVVNTAAAREHVAEIERAIQTIKERVQAICSTLPFSRLHKLILTNVLYFAVLWLNALPLKSGVSTKFSAREIVARTKLS